jgi:RNase P/RNase MRP subunit p30
MEQIILREENFSRLKELIKKNSNKEVIFSSDNNELNQKVLEKLKISVLLINLEGRKDFAKQRNSGFNQVMAKLANKNNILIGINLDELVLSSDKVRILARLRQNVEICNRNKIQMKFIEQKIHRDNYDLKSLGLVLKMPTWMTKQL